MNMEEYLENHTREDEQPATCHLCGTDYGNIWYFEGENWCEDCVENAFYYCDGDEFDEEVYCSCCGEPITGKVYSIDDADGSENYLCEECFWNAVEYGICN